MTKRDAILGAAVMEFAKQGFNNASMDVIAKNAKVAKGTVFYHFSSKEKLFATIVEEGKDRFEQQVKESIAKLQDPVAQVEKIIEVEVRFIKKFRAFFRVYVNEFLKKSHHLPSIEKVIDDGKKAGIFRPKLDTNLAAITIFWTTAIAVLNNRNQGLKDLLLNGIILK